MLWAVCEWPRFPFSLVGVLKCHRWHLLSCWRMTAPVLPGADTWSLIQFSKTSVREAGLWLPLSVLHGESTYACRSLRVQSTVHKFILVCSSWLLSPCLSIPSQLGLRGLLEASPALRLPVVHLSPCLTNASSRPFIGLCALPVPPWCLSQVQNALLSSLLSCQYRTRRRGWEPVWVLLSQTEDSYFPNTFYS